MLLLAQLALATLTADTRGAPRHSSGLTVRPCATAAREYDYVRGSLATAASAVLPTLRLRGGREAQSTLPDKGGADVEDARKTRARKENKLPDVGEAMKAKILKHRQMRKTKVPEDPDEAKAKLERKRLRDERRERKDTKRVESKKLKTKDRTHRPFMRKRTGEKKHDKERASKVGRTHDVSAGAVRERGKIKIAPENAQGGFANKTKIPTIPMPARESIRRPFWDPQGKGRDIGSDSPVQRKRARERLLQALVAVQAEHERNASSTHAHDEVFAMSSCVMCRVLRLNLIYVLCVCMCVCVCVALLCLDASCARSRI